MPISTLFQVVIFFMLMSVGPLWGQQKAFIPYEQEIKGTKLSIRMIPISAGTFKMGGNKGEITLPDEEPAHEVAVSAFWMAEIETTWNLYNLFIAREIDKLNAGVNLGTEVNIDVNAVSGATVPYVDMSFGMGAYGYPAINMTQFAASKFFEWLSAMTGNFYRFLQRQNGNMHAKPELKRRIHLEINLRTLMNMLGSRKIAKKLIIKVDLKSQTPGVCMTCMVMLLNGR